MSQYNFVLQSLHKGLKIEILLQFLTIEPHFVRIFADRISFRAKRSQRLTIEPRFVRKGCISWRLVGTAPRLKREIDKKKREEGKRARGQEGKKARKQESKRARGQEREDVKLRRCEDVKKGR